MYENHIADITPRAGGRKEDPLGGGTYAGARSHRGGLPRDEASRRAARGALGASGSENRVALPRHGNGRRGDARHGQQPSLHAGRRCRGPRRGRDARLRRPRRDRGAVPERDRRRARNGAQHHYRRRRRSRPPDAHEVSGAYLSGHRRLRGDDDRYIAPAGDGPRRGAAFSDDARQRRGLQAPFR